MMSSILAETYLEMGGNKEHVGEDLMVCLNYKQTKIPIIGYRGKNMTLILRRGKVDAIPGN